MVFETLILFLKAHSIILSFFGGFITGETVIVSLAFLSAQGTLPLFDVLVFSTLGMYLSSFIPFLVGRFKFFQNLWEKEKFVKKVEKIEDNFKRYTHNNIFLMLLYTKFFYGASIPALLYLGSKKTSIKKFAFYDFLVELTFVPIVVLVGWLAGKGFKAATEVFHNIRIGIFLLIVLIVVIYQARKWLTHRLMKKQKQSR